MIHNQLFSLAPDNIYVWIPVIIALISSVVAPYILSKRQGAENFSTNILQEGAEMRKELRMRIENLEKRLDDAQKEMNGALDAIRQLKSDNERCSEMVEDLRNRMNAGFTSTKDRFTKFDEPEEDNS